MRERVKRVRGLIPSIILTVLSMIQALALELYWTKLVESDFLWGGNWVALVGWLQFAAMFFGILLIWLLYVSLMLRFNWLPSLEDSLVPFLIGLLEFALVDLTHPDLIGPWLLVLAAIFVVAVFTSHTISRRARSDPENDYFFSKYDPAGLKDYKESAISVVVLGSFGAILSFYPGMRGLAVLALLLTMTAMAYQYLQARRFWLHSLQADDDQATADPD